MELYNVSNPVNNIPPQEEVTLRSINLRRLSAIDAMFYVAVVDRNTRATSRRSTRLSSSTARNSLAIASVDAPAELSLCRQNDDEGDDDLAPTEAEKSMTVRSGCVILSKSMLGGGASARSSAVCACAFQASP